MQNQTTNNQKPNLDKLRRGKEHSGLDLLKRPTSRENFNWQDPFVREKGAPRAHHLSCCARRAPRARKLRASLSLSFFTAQ
jgi:hypothetical protein